MNNPPYIVTDEFTNLIQAVSTALTTPVGATPAKLNSPVYSYFGYVTELNASLMQMSESPSLFNKKFPLVWLVTPFTVSSGPVGIYGVIDELRMFLITDSKKDYKAKDRVTNIFKPILNPIQYEIFNQMEISHAFAGYKARRNFKVTDHYYWGENQQSVLNDVVDTTELRFQKVNIQNNKNCLI